MNKNQVITLTRGIGKQRRKGEKGRVEWEGEWKENTSKSAIHSKSPPLLQSVAMSFEHALLKTEGC